MVLHVRANYDPKRAPWFSFASFLDPDLVASRSGTEPERFAVPLEGEVIVEKVGHDAFLGTQLDDFLRKKGMGRKKHKKKVKLFGWGFPSPA